MATARTRQRYRARSRALRCLVTIVMMMATAVVPFGADSPRALASSDTTPPQLLAFSATPPSIDTSVAAATITMTAHITDDLAGLSNGGNVPISLVELRGPGGTQLARGYLSQAQRISGTALDGVYRTTLIIFRFAEPGAWQASVVLTDAQGNANSYTAAQLGAAGFTASVQQAGAGDNVAPSVASLTVAPSSIDTSATSVAITFSARLTDALAGVSSGTTAPASQIVLQGPSASHQVTASFTQRISGSSLDGIYAAQATVPRYSEQGTWTVVSLTVYDNVGNARTFGAAELIGTTFTPSFQQTGVGDVNAPKVMAFTLSTPVLDTSTASAPLTLRIRLTDNLSGVAMGIVDSPSQVTFRSPSGNQQFVASFGNAQMQSGTVLDGWYSYTAIIPKSSEQGTWTVSAARIVDTAHNATVLDGTEWSQLGLASSVDVRSDGTAGAPTNVNVAPTPNATQATVSWVAPSNAGASPISQYTVTVAPAATTFTALGSANSLLVTGLTSGLSYNFSVHATNLAGNGAESVASGWFIAGGVPDLAAPQLIDVAITPIATETTSGPSTLTIDLSITDDVSGLVDGTQPTSLSSIAFNMPDGSAGPTIAIAARNIVSGTAAVGTYEVTVTLPQNSAVGTWPIAAVTLLDALGHSATYNNATLSTLGAATGFVVTPAGTPTAPLAVSATAGDQSVFVTWLAPIDNGSSPITGYTITTTPGNKSVSVGPGNTQATITGLHNATSYTVVAQAKNAIGSGVASGRSNAVIPGSIDQTAPQLQALSISPLVLAPSTGPQTVTVSARIVDGVSGVADNAPYSAVLFQDPLGGNGGRVDFSAATRVSGTVNDGMYSAAFAIAPNAPAGTYPIGAVVLIDRAGNQMTLGPSQLAASGFPLGFTIGGGTPPDPPTNVSAAGGNQSATVSWAAPQNTGASVLVAYSVVASPGGNASTVNGTTTSATVTGLTNGVSYTFTVVAANVTNTSAPSQPSNAVVPGGPDISPPVLGSLVASPNAVDPRAGPVTVSVALHISDGGSGLADAPPSSILVAAPSGLVTAYTFTSAQLVGGDALNGDYVVPIPITTNSETGTWSVDGVVLHDAAGNAATLDASQLASWNARSFVVAGGRVPGAPTNVRASAGGGGLTVSWSAPTDVGTSAITSSTVIELTTGLRLSIVASATSVFIANVSLPKRASLSFQVAATNLAGTGAASAPSAPFVTSASGATFGSCLVSSPFVVRGGTASVRSCGNVGWSSRPRRRRWAG